MQILAEVGYEDKKSFGFGAIKGKVEKLITKKKILEFPILVSIKLSKIKN